MFILLMRYVVIEANWTQYVIIRPCHGIFVYLADDYLWISKLYFVLDTLNWLIVSINIAILLFSGDFPRIVIDSCVSIRTEPVYFDVKV